MLRSSLRAGRQDGRTAGRHAGIRVAGGAASGSLFWGLCSAAGLTAITAALAQAFRAVEERPGSGPGPGFRAGLLSNVLSPKVGLFFLTVMP